MVKQIPFDDLVEKLQNRESAEFQPYVFYNEAAEELEVCLSPDEREEHPVDSCVSVYFSTEGRKRILGFSLRVGGRVR